MIVVDSSVWISLFRREEIPQTDRLSSIIDKSAIIVPDLVVVELLQGARDDRHAATIERDLSAFLIVSVLAPELAPAAARHYRELRRHGMTVRSTIDLVIATFCIANDLALLHRDRDFEAFVAHCGLRVA